MTSWIAAQAWINTVGLGLDFMGVLLLALEWRLAMQHEAAEAQIAAREEMLRPRPNMPRPTGPAQAVFDDMAQRRRFQDQARRAAGARTRRRGWFVASLVIIALGFLLQMIGSLPLGAVGVG